MNIIEHKNSKANKVGVSYRMREDAKNQLGKLAAKYNFTETTVLEILITYASSCDDKKLNDLILHARIAELNNHKQKLEKLLNIT